MKAVGPGKPVFLFQSLGIHIAAVVAAVCWLTLNGQFRPDSVPAHPSAADPIPVSIFAGATTKRAPRQVTEEITSHLDSPPASANNSRIGASRGVKSLTQPQPQSQAHLITDYLARIRSSIDAVLAYPKSLQRRGITGRVILELTIDPHGRVLDVGIRQSSGSPELDRLAIEAVTRAEPFDRPSTSPLLAQPISLRLPVEFRVN